MGNSNLPSVLFIDDDLDYLEILRRGLSDEFDIIAIESFPSLKEKIHGLRPSLVLLDFHLGHADPLEVIEYIKSLDFFQEIPLYLVSGSDTGRKAGFEKKVNGFIIKPSTFSGVREMLHVALSPQPCFSGS